MLSVDGCLGGAVRASRDETAYRLARPHAGAPAPVLDESQQAVVDHPGGPLLVLAGPGTGKTTTLVEAVVDRIENRGANPESVLALTFSRKAAEQLRDRVTARLGRTTSTAICSTFHSFAYGLIRRYSPPSCTPGRCACSAPRSRTSCSASCSPTTRSRCSGPTRCGGRSQTRGFAHEVPRCSAGPGRRGSTRDALRALGEEHDLPEFVAAGLVPRAVPRRTSTPQGATDYADLIRRAVIEATDHQTSSARSSSTSSSTSTRTPTRARCACSGRSPATGAT